MASWKNVTNTFSEKRRHYMNTYLEICEVYDEAVEVSVFSSESQSYEIYVSYGRMYGIIYSNAEEAYAKLEEIKKFWRKNTKKTKNLRLNSLKILLKSINWNFLRTYFFDVSAIVELDSDVLQSQIATIRNKARNTKKN